MTARARAVERHSSRVRRSIVVAVTSVAVTVVVGVTALLLTSPTGGRGDQLATLPATSMATAVTVDGHPVPLRELMLQVAADRAATFAYFEQNYHARDAAGFWHKRFGGTTPAEYLTTRAVADTVKIVTERLLAQSHGLLGDPGYPAFLTAWATENSRRAAAMANHQVIYGPQQYSEASYFTYVMADLGPRLERALIKDGNITITDTDVKGYYLTHREKFPSTTFQAVQVQAQQLYLDQAFETYVAAKATHARVVEDANVLRAIPLG